MVSDVDQEAEKAKALVLEEMSQCMKEYTANRCGTDVRLPALEQVCRNWEMCMNRDSEAVGRARVSAHTFAVIVNSFVEPISWKAMVRLLSLLSNIPSSPSSYGIRHTNPHRYSSSSSSQPPS